MTQTEPREVTRDDALQVFVSVTSGAHEDGIARWKVRAANGMTDDELEVALKWEIGIEGGWCGPSRISAWYKSSGLRMWASWNTVSPDTHTKPIFEGKSTMAMARLHYGVKDPTDKQEDLF